VLLWRSCVFSAPYAFHNSRSVSNSGALHSTQCLRNYDIQAELLLLTISLFLTYLPTIHLLFIISFFLSQPQYAVSAQLWHSGRAATGGPGQHWPGRLQGHM
jgi:hypothetical protein